MLKLIIASPERPFFSGSVDSVVLPGKSGEFEVLYNHIAIMSLLQAGTIIAYPSNGSPVAFCIDAGIVQVNKNIVSVLVDSAFEARQKEERQLIAKQNEYRNKLSRRTKADYTSLIKQLALLSSELHAIDRIRKNRNNG